MSDSFEHKTPFVEPIKCNYENFICICYYCGEKLIFNRATDLKTVAPIGGRNVTCYKCQKLIRIGMDRINPAYELFMFDCDELLIEKKYMQCVINCAQALEIFLFKYIKIKSILLPIQQNAVIYLDLDILTKNFNIYFADYTFFPLRNVFFDLFIYDRSFQTTLEITNYLSSIKTSKVYCNLPSDDTIMLLPNEELKSAMLLLKTCKASQLRNDIIHKSAYRPSKTEAEACLKETDQIIYGIANQIPLQDDDTYYYPRLSKTIQY